MRTISRSVPSSLSREEREVQRRISTLRQRRNRWCGMPDLPSDGSIDVFEAALEVSVEQHEEVIRLRLADKSQALAAALERVREGTYGICRECGGRIPQRRLEAIPTATRCLPCQERREANGTEGRLPTRSAPDASDKRKRPCDSSRTGSQLSSPS